MTDQTENRDATASDGGDLPPDRSDEKVERVRPEQSEDDLAKASDVEEYMRDVIDPELGINVVDLGLVYDIWIENGDEAIVQMTLTSPACHRTCGCTSAMATSLARSQLCSPASGGQC